MSDIRTMSSMSPVNGLLDAVYQLNGNALGLHGLKNAAHGVVSDEGGAIGPWEEAKDLLQAGAKGGDGHISAADEAVAGGNDGANSGGLTLGGEVVANEARQSGSEHDEKENVQQYH